MLLQFITHIIPVITAGIIAYFTYYLSILLMSSSAGAFQDLKWLLEVTPALNTFFVFISKAAYLLGIILCAFGRTSNHIVISLDILYLVSFLMLILFHTLKQPNNSLVKVA